MPTNPYFKDYSGEQDVTEDLTIEIIKTMGREMYYVPRNMVEFDKIFGEGTQVSYKDSVPLEMYIDSLEDGVAIILNYLWHLIVEESVLF